MDGAVFIYDMTVGRENLKLLDSIFVFFTDKFSFISVFSFMELVQMMIDSFGSKDIDSVITGFCETILHSRHLGAVFCSRNSEEIAFLAFNNDNRILAIVSFQTNIYFSYYFEIFKGDLIEQAFNFSVTSTRSPIALFYYNPKLYPTIFKLKQL